jgi:hypothetical protein
MSTFERVRAGSALALKIQTTDGTDAIAGTPAAGDWISASFTPPPLDVRMSPDPTNTGSLDDLPPIVGGASVSVPFRMVLRGSGTAATAPAAAKILRAASLLETATAVAVGVPTAATAGTTTTATLAAPFAATADLYAGMPATLSGNPAIAVTTMITGYTVGRVATFGRTFGSVLTTSTLAQIPINNRYGLSDLESDWKRLTAYVYHAGQLLILLDCQVMNPALEFTAGQPAVLTGTLMGIIGTTWAETTLPSGAATAMAGQQTPPLWIGGESQLGRAIARASSMSIALGTGLMLPDNPENANGFDSPQIMARAIRATINIFANSSLSPARTTLFRAGTDTVWSGMLGTAAGNRFGWVMPAARIVGMTPGDRNGMAVDVLTLQPSSPGAGFYFTAF